MYFLVRCIIHSCISEHLLVSSFVILKMSSQSYISGNMSYDDLYSHYDDYSLGNISCNPNSWDCISNITNISLMDYVATIHDHVFPRPTEWCLIVLNVLVLVIGLLGNFLVCFVVYRNSSMQSVTNIFIVNLAVADFCVLLFCLPPTVVWDVTETWFFGTLLCKLILYFQVRENTIISN